MQSARFYFFSGKGGVGKTSMASATAIHYAELGNKTLIVTTDPASNLSDVFQQEVGHGEIPINGVDNLWAMEIDPDKAADEYRQRIIAPLREFLPKETMKVVEEQFNSPCTTEIAAFDRFVDLMDDPAYDVVIFDTAPTGHTIRLLQLPVEWSKYIEKSPVNGQTCMGPLEAIQGSKKKYDRAIRILRDSARTSFIFVLQLEETPIEEALRSSKELEAIGIRAIEIIINGILPAEECVNPFFVKRKEMQDRYMKIIDDRFSGTSSRKMYLLSDEISGVEILRQVGQMLFESKQNQYLKGARF